MAESERPPVDPLREAAERVVAAKARGSFDNAINELEDALRRTSAAAPRPEGPVVLTPEQQQRQRALTREILSRPEGLNVERLSRAIEATDMLAYSTADAFDHLGYAAAILAALPAVPRPKRCAYVAEEAADYIDHPFVRSERSPAAPRPEGLDELRDLAQAVVNEAEDYDEDGMLRPMTVSTVEKARRILARLSAGPLEPEQTHSAEWNRGNPIIERLQAAPRSSVETAVLREALDDAARWRHINDLERDEHDRVLDFERCQHFACVAARAALSPDTKETPRG